MTLTPHSEFNKSHRKKTKMKEYHLGEEEINKTIVRLVLLSIAMYKEEQSSCSDTELLDGINVAYGLIWYLRYKIIFDDSFDFDEISDIYHDVNKVRNVIEENNVGCAIRRKKECALGVYLSKSALHMARDLENEFKSIMSSMNN
jgi:hypothetical protein